jgi:adenosine deaminase
VRLPPNPMEYNTDRNANTARPPHQIGLSVSPLSNNFLFRKLNQNPFPNFFKRGLNVTLSTDDPLLFHMSDDALLEGKIESRLAS